MIKVQGIKEVEKRLDAFRKNRKKLGIEVDDYHTSNLDEKWGKVL